MRIKWTITKKRGNFRPHLNYTITLETFEKDLAVNALTIKSLIPRIPNPSRAFCMPGEDERDPSWTANDYHYMSVPYFKTGEVREFIRLPFWESGHHPEVEGSFSLLRQAYEEVVKQAYNFGPISENGEMDISAATQKAVAARVAGAKLLNLYGNSRMN